MTAAVVGSESSAPADAVDDGIEHGTARGARQHQHRKVPMGDCGCREAHNAYQRDRRRARRAPRPRLAPTGECFTAGCGEDLAYHRQRPFGWLQIQVTGSSDLPHLYCSGACATHGIALAELRALREPA